MKHISARDFLLKLDEIIAIITISATNGLSPKLVFNTIIYLASGHERGEVDLFINKIANSKLHNHQEDVMNFVESLKQEGRQEGRQEIVNNMLHAGFKPEDVAKTTGMPLQDVKKLQKQNHIEF